MLPNHASERRHPVLLTGAVAGLMLVAAACGSSSPSSGSSPTPSPTGAGPAVTATQSPSPGGTSAAATGCETGGAPAVSGSGPSDPAAAGTSVAENFSKFFSPSTPSTEKVALLQNGEHLTTVLQGFAGNPLASKASVTVTAVEFTSPTMATVTYNLCQSGTPALPNAKGTAVLENGTWKVSDTTLCSLVALSNNGKSVPGCS
ncbi:hypothetical protein [Streptacidiphilus neutrinimicus]|uniref:hypothetical protein n=1 Tax=Streptacidiphilus neutrinimicus TaxID=105420 RepID=UPI0005A67103|nr:hypothetical protein [Streptacidiphilus neutrinimicus]